MSIDRRIVDMQFDNKQFEQGVKQTNDSLAQLNDSLKLEGAAKGLTDVSKASKGFDVSGITEGVGLLESRFTTMGIIGMEAIKNLTNSAVNAGKNIVKNFIDPIFSGGKRRAINLEQAEFQFRGLGMDVEKTMASANEAVLGTAYGLDSAAKAAGQFGATGMEAGEEMTKALRGISGVAAMTGRDYDDVARIFTTVSGNGRLMGMQLTQLGSYGINAAATMAKAFNKTEAEVRKMASDGQISFEMFYQAMDGAFGNMPQKLMRHLMVRYRT